MSYFVDLSPYSYIERQHPIAQNKINYQELNLGWLDKQFPFLKALTERTFHKHLFDFCQYRINQTRGFHGCDFCSSKKGRSDVISFGSCEARVFDLNGTVYASPEMICHYVVAHQYRPPDVFVNAVMHGPQPFTIEYEKLLTDYGFDWSLQRTPYPPSLMD